MKQSRVLTDRNRIRGRAGRTSGHRATKSISIKGTRGKSGRGAVKAVELTSGGLPRVLARGGGTEGFVRGLTAWQKSAEGVVVRDVGEAREALRSRKAQPTDRPSRERRTKARTVWSGK